MVSIKRVELAQFKSFGGTTAVPFLPGFTVVSGPNGSGKSNILDALLFCLGLATSKGMRAERLPDLVNTGHTQQRQVAETQVSVTFDLADLEALEPPLTPEWTVSRRLRVARTGTYTSTYYINSQPCTVNELHELLNRLHIYPEGYNVVLQGDVTRIITMNGKERREIIDELAGVAEFDRKISKTRETLAEVREREERCQIIVQELVRVLERLTGDRTKAEKYQKLKEQIHGKQHLEKHLQILCLENDLQQLEQQSHVAQQEQACLGEALRESSTLLTTLNQQVKALGEEEHLNLAQEKARQQAQYEQLQQRQGSLTQAQEEERQTAQALSQERDSLTRQQEQIECQQETLTSQTLPQAEAARAAAQDSLAQLRERATAIAASSQAWVEEQSQISRTLNQLQTRLNPLLGEKAQLQERIIRLEQSLSSQKPQQTLTQTDLSQQREKQTTLSQTLHQSQRVSENLTQELSLAQQAQIIYQDTQKRLLKEQRDKQREVDKLEATQIAQQEAQGSYASQVILTSDLPGVCGLVAQLGDVDKPYQVALEIAAGGRLGQIVVEDDSIAAAGIALLKQRQVGRATFLPLNKIHAPRPQDIYNLRSTRGFIDLAVNLVRCDPRYGKIFAYVFGQTLVFEDLDCARFHLGKYRMVTLGGDLLETSGAMTGGSQPSRQSLHFGQIQGKDSSEIQEIKQRLADIEQILRRNEALLQEKIAQVQHLGQQLNEAKQVSREAQLQQEQVEREIKRLLHHQQTLEQEINHSQQELTTAQGRFQALDAEIPVLTSQLQQEQEKLTRLEASTIHSQWQQLQTLIKEGESRLHQQEELFRQRQNEFKNLDNERVRIAEKIDLCQERLEGIDTRKESRQKEQHELALAIEALEQQKALTESLLQKTLEKLGETKTRRDAQEEQYKALQNRERQVIWHREKIALQQQEKQEQLQEVRAREIPELGAEYLEEALKNLPENLDAYLESLQQEIRQSQKRLQGMEPVNMLALEEYEKNQERLGELADKIQTLEGERTELMVRVENFTTLRYRAFKEAFDAVNINFQSIFSALSDGDGYLQLENPEDPFEGGLTLVAHPKGKPVQRLSSMSGGEKSLTALSFIFALQRYRPSPFYAFDEVDMFLDGANVERLAKMIRDCAQQAQFIVVSLRRPMIEAAQRTIGVTQARGAYTQVLGIKV